jgi:hypothetical protein
MKADANERILAAIASSKEICEDRYKTYGDPLTTYKAISGLTATFLKNQSVYRDIDEETMICLEILKKLVRIQKNPGHLDSWNDIIGYAACGHAISDRKHGRG